MTSETSRRQPRPSTPKESGLLQRARRFLEERFPGQVPHLVVGYSGGKDSLALLLVLSELQRLGGCRLGVVHVDHALRAESAEDAARAVEVGNQLGVRVEVARPDRPVTELFPGRGIEHAARSYRYGVLARAAEESGAHAIAVAHHADDQAETVLLHLLRGSGLAGLSGMAPDAVLPVPGSGAEMRVIRPFLHQSPETLEALVAASGLPVIEDPSNASPDFRRNRIRRELLPLMEDIAPGATGRLGALADVAHEDDVTLDEVAAMSLGRSLDGETLRWESIQGAPQGLRRRVVRQWLSRFAGVDELSLDRVDAVIELAERGQGGKRVDVGDGWRVRYRSGQLDIVRPGKKR